MVGSCNPAEAGSRSPEDCPKAWLTGSKLRRHQIEGTTGFQISEPEEDFAKLYTQCWFRAASRHQVYYSQIQSLSESRRQDLSKLWVQPVVTSSKGNPVASGLRDHMTGVGFSSAFPGPEKFRFSARYCSKDQHSIDPFKKQIRTAAEALCGPPVVARVSSLWFRFLPGGKLSFLWRAQKRARKAPRIFK